MRSSWLGLMMLAVSFASHAQTVIVDTSLAGRHQTIDGFGAAAYSTTASPQGWYQQLLFDDLQASILRVDVTPTFPSPLSDNLYNSPGDAAGPDGNFVHGYTDSQSYSAPSALAALWAVVSRRARR